MFLTIGNVLEASAVASLRTRAAKLAWRDGSRTAGTGAKTVKKNEQADLSTEAGQSVAGDIMKAVGANAVVKAAAQPARFSPLLLSRTGIGGGYGAHVDNAVMGRGDARLRTDLSFTVFLSGPEDYEGGALTLDLPGGTQSLKPAAGDMVLYPSSQIHEVETVTKGERLVAVGWIQSQIRSAQQRQILFDLEQVRATLRAKPSKGDEMLLLDKAISNLLREWASL